jgi:hypothetical protein
MQAVIGNANNLRNQRLSVAELLGDVQARKDQVELEREKLKSNVLSDQSLDAYRQATVLNEQRKFQLEEQKAKLDTIKDKKGLAKLDAEIEALVRKNTVINTMLETGISYDKLSPAAKAILGSDPGADYRKLLEETEIKELSDEQKRLLRNDATSAVQKMGEVKEKDIGPYLQKYVDAKKALGEDIKQIPYFTTEGSPNRV